MSTPPRACTPTAGQRHGDHVPAEPSAHHARNPTGPILAIVGGAVILLLFVYVFGGTLGAGLTVCAPAATTSPTSLPPSS